MEVNAVKAAKSSGSVAPWHWETLKSCARLEH